MKEVDLHINIKDILRAHEENRLAIFVGAGVSANSGYKSWWQIVDRFNENNRYVFTGGRDYSDDEILKIPQFAFNENEEEYFEVLEAEYNKLPEDTNPITDMLVGLRPNHIITTNYDRLIEMSIEKQNVYGSTVYEDLSRYSKVINDIGFLSAKKPHFLIKMHGDLEDRDSVVLKEDDYLGFSATHTLVETFVRSLFVTHTILFVGYGLGDLNLKQIMSWVNGFAQETSEEDRVSKYYYINAENEKFPSYEKDYFERRNVFIVESSMIPKAEAKPNENYEHRFNDFRGENLFRTLNFIFYGFNDSIENIISNFKAYDNMNAITPFELYSAINQYGALSTIIDGIEYSWVNGYFQNRQVISELMNNQSSENSYLIRKMFKKAGIKGIALAEKEMDAHPGQNRERIGILELFWMSPEPQYEILWLDDICDDFYQIVISHDFSAILQIVNSSGDIQVDTLLKRAYLCAYLWEDEDAKATFHSLDVYLSEAELSFSYVAMLYNLNILDFDGRYHVLHKNMADRHKKQFYTLMELYDGFTELMRETIKIDNDIRKRITINAISQSSDLKFTDYKKLRGRIASTLRYFICNYIYIKGFSGARIITQWFDLIEIYLDMTLRILSPNSRMKVSNKYRYERISLTKEDIYFLTFYLKPETLTFYLNEHNITALRLDAEQQDFMLTLIKNTSLFNVLPEHARSSSQLANLFCCILQLIEIVEFDKTRLSFLFEHLTTLIVNILKMNQESGCAFFQRCFSPWLECIYALVRSEDDKSQIKENVKSLAESVLLHFALSDTTDVVNMEFQMKVFNERSLLRNLSNLLGYYFNEVITDSVFISFFERVALYEQSKPNIVANYVIELFPAMSESIKQKYRHQVQIRLASLEMRNIQQALETGAIAYDDNVDRLLLRACESRVKQKREEELDYYWFNNPLHVVTRLYEKGIISDLKPYIAFRGHYDLFDFVCFPEEFDYHKFDTNWSSWLSLEKYSSVALDKAFDIMKNKYESKMQEAPTENDKQVYYKFFKTTE